MPPRETQEVQAPGATGNTGLEVEITEEDMKELASMRKTELTATELPPISIDAINYAQANYDRMDGNGDGFVSAQELSGFEKANKGKLSTEDQKMVDELKSHMETLQSASNDETGWENDGFTRKDLVDSKTDATASTSAQSRTYDPTGGDIRPALDYANKNFDKMDADEDGFISVSEINTYMAENELTASETRMLRNLKSHSVAVGNLDKGEDGDELDGFNGISKKDISAANEQVNTLTFAVENFSALDADGNGFISAEEITGFERARDDLTGAQVKALDQLRNQVNSLQGESNDETGPENDGMTGYDLLSAMDKLGSANARGQAKLGDRPAETAIASTTPPEAGSEGERPEDPKAPEEVERTYTVKPNDSLWKICREDLRARNGKEPSYKDILHEIDQVAALNGIERDAIIHPEQTLKLRPASAQETPASPVEPTRVRPVEPTRVRPVEPTRIAPVEPTGIAPGEPAPPRRGEPRDEEDRPTERPRRDERPTRPQERNLSSTDVLRKHFDNIDLNGNKRVSEREIRQYLYDFGPEISDKDRIALNRIARQAGKIQELANDEKGDENTGISARDLQKVDEMQEAARIMQKSGMWMDFNTNGDKYLKKNEIEQALRRANISEEERRALNYLYDNYGKFQEGNNDERGDENSGITWNDLRWYASFV